jgi:YgiT-type zinc finger domain-containing protein
MGMKCEFCNAETTRRRVRKHHWFRGRLYIVENVDAEVCMECGERYFHATTLDKIDAVITSDHPIKELLSVEVLSAQDS